MNGSQTMYSPPSGPPPSHTPNGFPSPEVHKTNLGYRPPAGLPSGYGAPSMPTPSSGYQPRNVDYLPPRQFSNGANLTPSGAPNFPMPGIRSKSPYGDPPSSYPPQTWDGQGHSPAQQQPYPPQPTSMYSSPNSSYTSLQPSSCTPPIGTPTTYSYSPPALPPPQSYTRQSSYPESPQPQYSLNSSYTPLQPSSCTPPIGNPTTYSYSPPALPPPQSYTRQSSYPEAPQPQPSLNSSSTPLQPSSCTPPLGTPTTYSYTPPAVAPQSYSYQSSYPQAVQPSHSYVKPTSYLPPSGPPPSSTSTTSSGGFFNINGNSPTTSPPPLVPPRSSSGSNAPWHAPTAGPPPPAQTPESNIPPQEPPAHMPPVQMQYYTPSTGGPKQSFAWSQCTGKKRGLCIGINYFKQQGELRGCINDANNIKQFLVTQFGYKEKEIYVLTDNARDPGRQPTRANILQAMRWLVKDAQPNDSLFFHFSGHGGYTKDQDGDEADGYDEVIYPVDYVKAGHIVDDDLHDIMVKPLPAGCQLTAIFDSCHSGSALDLPYIYTSDGKVKEINTGKQTASTLAEVGKAYLAKDLSSMLRGAVSLAHAAGGLNLKAEEFSRRTKSSPANVISWAGCKDSQTSADVVLNGKGTGAMSYAFMAAIRRNPKQSYRELLVNIRGILRSEFSQKPQLSSSHPMDTSVIFIA